MSTTFVKLLPLEMGEITQFKEPTEEVKPNEKIICEMTDDQKKLFTLVWSYRRSVIDYKTKITFEGSSPELEAKFSEAVEKAEVLWNLLWVTVRDYWGLWGEECSYGIRKGWQIVSFHNDKTDFLKKLFGNM